MTKQKYSEGGVREMLTTLSQDEIPRYEKLMAKRGGLIARARQMLEEGLLDEETENIFQEIVKSSLRASVLVINKTEKISHRHIQREHSGLERAASRAYPREGEKCPWELLVEDAGLVYPRRYRKWTLRAVLEGISHLGEDPDDFRQKSVYRKDSGLVNATRRIVGNWGKGVILVGVDYLKNPKVNKRKHEFSGDELERIVNDKSLEHSGKVVAVFNAYALQYYPFEDGAWMKRDQESLDGFRLLVRKSFFGEPSIKVSHLQNTRNLESSAVSIVLEGAENRFNRQNFRFSGNSASEYSQRFYDSLF